MHAVFQVCKQWVRCMKCCQMVKHNDVASGSHKLLCALMKCRICKVVANINEHRGRCFVQTVDTDKMPQLSGSQRFIMYDVETVSAFCVYGDRSEHHLQTVFKIFSLHIAMAVQRTHLIMIGLVALASPAQKGKGPSSRRLDAVTTFIRSGHCECAPSVRASIKWMMRIAMSAASAGGFSMVWMRGPNSANGYFLTRSAI